MFLVASSGTHLCLVWGTCPLSAFWNEYLRCSKPKEAVCLFYGGSTYRTCWLLCPEFRQIIHWRSFKTNKILMIPGGSISTLLRLALCAYTSVLVCASCSRVFECGAGIALSLATLLHFSSVTSSSTLWDSWAGRWGGFWRGGISPPHPRLASRSSLTCRTFHLSAARKSQICKGRKTKQQWRSVDQKWMNQDSNSVRFNSRITKWATFKGMFNVFI